MKIVQKNVVVKQLFAEMSGVFICRFVEMYDNRLTYCM